MKRREVSFSRCSSYVARGFRILRSDYNKNKPEVHLTPTGYTNIIPHRCQYIPKGQHATAERLDVLATWLCTLLQRAALQLHAPLRTGTTSKAQNTFRTLINKHAIQIRNAINSIVDNRMRCHRSRTSKQQSKLFPSLTKVMALISGFFLCLVQIWNLTFPKQERMVMQTVSRRCCRMRSVLICAASTNWYAVRCRLGCGYFFGGGSNEICRISLLEGVFRDTLLFSLLPVINQTISRVNSNWSNSTWPIQFRFWLNLLWDFIINVRDNM